MSFRSVVKRAERQLLTLFSSNQDRQLLLLSSIQTIQQADYDYRYSQGVHTTSTSYNRGIIIIPPLPSLQLTRPTNNNNNPVISVISRRSFSSVPKPPSYKQDEDCVEDAPLQLSFSDDTKTCTTIATTKTTSSADEEGVGVVNYVKGENKEKASGCSTRRHVPVMVGQVLTNLMPTDDQLVLDMTFGAGGHAKEILAVAPNVRYIAADRDPLANGLAHKFSAGYRSGQVTPLLSRFSELPDHLEGQEGKIHPESVDCVLMDLGCSSMQFDTANRGFALSHNGPLDMRMDGDRFPDSPTAADVVNSLDASDLMRIIKKYGEERNARAIAHAIVEARYAFGKFTHTKQLADTVQAVFDSNFRRDKLHRHSHVATKTFQALRIFVNDELNEIHKGLQVAHRYLKPGGRCAVISFHSLEDRIVKRIFHSIDIDLDPRSSSLHGHVRRNSRVAYNNRDIEDKLKAAVQWLPLKRKVFEASEEEVSINPRSRSAKLRVAVKAG